MSFRAPLLFALAGLVLLVLQLSCSSGSMEEITPWLQLARHRPLIDMPHAFQSSEYRVAVRVRVAGAWHQAVEYRTAQAFREIDAVAFEAGRAVVVRGDRDSLVFREGTTKPATLDGEVCPFPYPDQGGRGLLCLSVVFELGPEKGADTYSQKAHLRQDGFDSLGNPTTSATLPLPKEVAYLFPYGANLLGWNRQGAIVVQGSLGCVAVVLAEEGAHEVLPPQTKSQCPTPAEWRPALGDLILPGEGASEQLQTTNSP